MNDREELLEETPSDALRAFLGREFEADPDLERRFRSFLGTSDIGVYELRAEIESKYGYRTAPNFTTYEERAESYIENGRYCDAATIYRAMFEAMRDHLHEFDPHRVASNTTKPFRTPSLTTQPVSATRTFHMRRNAGTSNTVSTNGSTNTRREASHSTSERRSGNYARLKTIIATGSPCCGTDSTNGSIPIDSSVRNTTTRIHGVAVISPLLPTRTSYSTDILKPRGCAATSNCSTASKSRQNSEPSSTDTILRLDTSVSDTPVSSRTKTNAKQPLALRSTGSMHSLDRIQSRSVSSSSTSTRVLIPRPSGKR
jgi:hypothetical protein